MEPVQFTLKENFLLLALNEKKGRFYATAFHLNYGFIGAILLELAMLKKIEVKEKKVILIDREATGDPVLDEMLSLIREKGKNKTMTYWIRRKGSNPGKWKRKVMDGLVDKRILSKKLSRVLGIFPSRRYPISNPKPKRLLTVALRSITLHNKKPGSMHLYLISLAYPTSIINKIYQSGKERRKGRKTSKTLVKSSEESRIADQAMKEVQAAVAASLVAVTSAVAAGGGSN